jgi:catechol 2,3-dioxygenase-like lactoylglutathione lyase family enzyme
MIEGLNEIEVISLFAEDVAATKAFYQTVFGAPIVYEDEVSAVFKLQNLLINLLQASEAPELVEPLAVGRSDVGPRLMLTVRVENVDRVCEQLRELGVALLNGPVDRPWGRRTAAFADPAGNVWEVAQLLPA